MIRPVPGSMMKTPGTLWFSSLKFKRSVSKSTASIVRICVFSSISSSIKATIVSFLISGGLESS